MKPRRILHFTRQLTYGCGNVVYQLTSALDRQRYEAIIAFESHEQSRIRNNQSESEIKTIYLKKGHNRGAANSPKSKGKGRNISELLASKFSARFANIYLALKSAYQFFVYQAPKIRHFVKLIRDNKIDLVHIHCTLPHSKPVIIAARISGTPCILHMHGYIEPTWFEYFFLIYVDAFIYISNDVADHFYLRKFPRSKGNTIHNGLDLSNFLQQGPPDDVRSEFNIKSDDILVGMVGRIDWWKGHEYFIEAFAKAVKKITGIRGMVIGEAGSDSINQQYFNMLKTKLDSLNLDGKIICTGFRSDVPRLMAAMDIVVHASSQPEPFGLVVIEGMAAGKPVVATAAGGILDIIQDGVNGLLVPCKDSNSMAKAIIELASNKNKAKRMGRASRQRIVDKFTIEHQAAAVEQLYDSLLGTT